MADDYIKAQDWLMRLAYLIEALHQPEFPKRMLESVRSVADFDSSVIMAYRIGARPKILYDEIAEEYRNVFYNRYVQQDAFLLSPIYQKFRAGETGFFHFKEIVSDDFFDSEYYHKYYGHSGLIDQIFYLKPLHNGVAIVESLARTKKFHAYTKPETHILKLFEPIFNSLIAKNWEYLENEKLSFSDYLHRGLKNFGSSVLTRQEKRVVNCILAGGSSKSIAREMNISPETERSYRKIIYQKLNVSSHSQLHHLFFLALDFAKRAEEQDPLELLKQSANQRPPAKEISTA